MTIETRAHRVPGRKSAWGAAAIGALMLTGCMTPAGFGGYPPGGTYPQERYPQQPYPQQPYPGQSARTVVGTVRAVDPGGRLVLDVQNSSYGGGYGNGSGVEVLFDQRTQLYYQGRPYPVTGLEPGDQIRIETTQSGGRVYARSIEVLQNVRDRSGGQYGNELAGAVTYVDTRSRVIEFTRGGYSGAAMQVRYDERTVVEFRGQAYRPENLERGDVIRIQARQWGNDWMAQRIVVETSARERY